MPAQCCHPPLLPLRSCLFYGPVATKPCGHRFCAGCIRGARDCPICGADIVKAEPAAELQEQVETYIQAHAASHTLWELEATSAGSGANVEEPQVGVDADGSKVERSRAVFLLALGLRALSAGNIDAAAARLGQSAAELETQLEEDGGDGLSTAGNTADKRTEMLHLRLGTVYGALGDISRRAGDAPVALQRYEQSLQQLERAGGDAAALDARAVTVSKLGELRHLSGDLAAAAEAYHRALDLRRCALARLEPTAASSSIGGQADEHMAAILGVAASLIKLADVQQSLAQTTASGSKGDGPAPSPAVLLAEAGELLARLKGGTGAGVLSPALQRKLAAIEQYVQG